MPARSELSGPHQRLTWKVTNAQPGAWSFGVWQNFVIGVWSAKATAEAVGSLGNTARSLKEKYTSLHIIKSGAALPTADGRAALVELLKERTGKLACITVVLLGSGFWASAVQSMITGLHMVAPSGSTKLRICDTIEDAVAWLAKEHGTLTGVDVNASDLRTVLTDALATAE
jgi:hypothetical protein